MDTSLSEPTLKNEEILMREKLRKFIELRPVVVEGGGRDAAWEHAGGATC